MFLKRKVGNTLQVANIIKAETNIFYKSKHIVVTGMEKAPEFFLVFIIKLIEKKNNALNRAKPQSHM